LQLIWRSFQSLCNATIIGEDGRAIEGALDVQRCVVILNDALSIAGNASGKKNSAPPDCVPAIISG